jgi:predicted RNA binding protein YcfA (HicA-like mRNA interferase family)
MAKFGWTVEKQRGSHLKLIHASGGMLIVAFHGTLSRNSVRRALRQAGIEEGEFARAL